MTKTWPRAQRGCYPPPPKKKTNKKNPQFQTPCIRSKSSCVGVTAPLTLLGYFGSVAENQTQTLGNSCTGAFVVTLMMRSLCYVECWTKVYHCLWWLKSPTRDELVIDVSPLPVVVLTGEFIFCIPVACWHAVCSAITYCLASPGG